MKHRNLELTANYNNASFNTSITYMQYNDICLHARFNAKDNELSGVLASANLGKHIFWVYDFMSNGTILTKQAVRIEIIENVFIISNAFRNKSLSVS